MPNKKHPDMKEAEEERDAVLKTVEEMKIENTFLKKNTVILYKSSVHIS